MQKILNDHQSPHVGGHCQRYSRVSSRRLAKPNGTAFQISERKARYLKPFPADPGRYAINIDSPDCVCGREMADGAILDGCVLLRRA